MSCYEGIVKFSWGKCNRVDIFTNKHINLYYFCLLSFIIKSYGTKTISIPLSLLKVSFTSGQDVLSSPQQTGCNPSLANEAHLVSATHPGASFPVHHPQEVVPKLTNGTLSPSLPWSTLFMAHINSGPAGGTIFPSVPGLKYTMMFY